ncbi:MAG: bifunctional tRNA (5-methylaminomethyl-2-thiouridine)(34)-methyltransferase MnmD/FAD-dependent 5-carboxymethylaminomethyl-2-thiouridine(34) oxidoreductase MnmC [Campylobacter sp.]
MKPAEISYKNGTPYSKKFDDIYFNTHRPLAESEYVFCSALDEISLTQVNILETGFGTGLNFLLSAKKIINTTKRLNFVSIEANPISKEDLAKIYDFLGLKDSFVDDFLKLYPPLVNGFHRLNLTPNITLTLCFYDVLNALDELSFKANLIFLDGFAPNKNESMWSDEVVAKIANLSSENAILRTYTASSRVQKSLKKFGFNVDLIKGYGKKREMINAKFLAFKSMQTHVKTAYFSRFDTFLVKPKTALIVGSGIAGCAMAFKLKKLGVDVIIAEKTSQIATNGSSNHCGILMPLITKPDVKLGQMHLNAFLQAVRFYAQNLSDKEFKICGAIEYAYEQKFLERLEKWSEFDNENGVFEINFNSLPYPKAYIKNGANVRAKKVCQTLSNGIKMLFGYELIGFENLINGGVNARFANGKTLQSDVLILALGSESMDFFNDYEMQLSSVRGQVTHIEPIFDTSPFSAIGYVCQAVDGVQVVGATYDRNLFVKEARKSDDEKNLNNVSEFLLEKTPKIIGSNVCFRGYSGDRFPLVGRLYDEKSYKQTYKSLLWSKNKAQVEPKYVPNVYVSTAHGSRGLGTAVLSAELICDLIFDRPLCVEKSVFDDMHLARFLIRRLKKGL